MIPKEYQDIIIEKYLHSSGCWGDYNPDYNDWWYIYYSQLVDPNNMPTLPSVDNYPLCDSSSSSSG